MEMPEWWTSVEEAATYEHYEFPRGYRANRHDGRFYFDAELAAKCINFAPLWLRHTKGSLGPLVLEPWQKAIIATLFGWKRKSDGMRRFRMTYIEVARGNGKSTMCVLIAALLMFVDQEPGAEIVGAAYTRDQAREVFGQFRSNIMCSDLAKTCTVMRDSVVYEDATTGISRAVYKIISSDGNSAQGGNHHGIIVDELHVQRDRWFWDSLRGGTLKRRQPLTVAITTAGSDRESICFEQRTYAEYVAKNPDADEACMEFLPVIYAADPDDDWREPATWRKANPNLGVSIKEEDIAKEALKAAASPGYLNAFKRLHLNIWTEQSILCLNMEHWDACDQLEEGEKYGDRYRRMQEELEGEECYGGLDMAGRNDVAAFVLWFPERKACLPWFWVPQEMVEKRAMNPSNLGRYQQWVAAGLMEATPGSWIEERVIQQKIIEVSGRYNLRNIVYDPWNADATRIVLEEAGIDCRKFPQTAANYAAPFAKLKELIDTEQLLTGSNPVLRWMAANTHEIVDTNNNARPCKKRSPDKIDGISGLTMAIGASMAEEESEFHYEPGQMIL